MAAEGAKIQVRGDGFPLGAAAEMDPLVQQELQRLQTPQEQPKAKPQELEQIPDAVIASAFVLVEDDMLEDQAEFAAQAASASANPPPPERRSTAEGAAMQNFRDVLEAAERAGVFIRIQFRREGEDFEE